jgi:hypothetical protein
LAQLCNPRIVQIQFVEDYRVSNSKPFKNPLKCVLPRGGSRWKNLLIKARHPNVLVDMETVNPEINLEIC